MKLFCMKIIFFLILYLTKKILINLINILNYAFLKLIFHFLYLE